MKRGLTLNLLSLRCKRLRSQRLGEGRASKLQRASRNMAGGPPRSAPKRTLLSPAIKY
jgi:hypothetical protein